MKATGSRVNASCRPTPAPSSPSGLYRRPASLGLDPAHQHCGPCSHCATQSRSFWVQHQQWTAAWDRPSAAQPVSPTGHPGGSREGCVPVVPGQLRTQDTSLRPKAQRPWPVGVGSAGREVGVDAQWLPSRQDQLPGARWRCLSRRS